MLTCQSKADHNLSPVQGADSAWRTHELNQLSVCRVMVPPVCHCPCLHSHSCFSTWQQVLQLATNVPHVIQRRQQQQQQLQSLGSQPET